MDLICPICGSKLNTFDKSLVCAGHHCFDIARQGYVNLLTVQQKHSLLCPVGKLSHRHIKVNSEVVMYLRKDVFQRGRRHNATLYRKTKPVCLSRTVIGVLT